jgi:hypothetical protein
LAASPFETLAALAPQGEAQSLILRQASPEVIEGDAVSKDEAAALIAFIFIPVNTIIY